MIVDEIHSSGKEHSGRGRNKVPAELDSPLSFPRSCSILATQRPQGDASYADELYAAATGSNDTAFLVGQFAGVLDAEGIVLDSVRRGLVVVLNTTSAVPTFDEYLLELSSIASKPSTPSRLVIDLIALSAVAVVVLLMALIDRRRKSQAAMRASNRQEQESPDGNLGPDEGNAATEPAPVPEE